MEDQEAGHTGHLGEDGSPEAEEARESHTAESRIAEIHIVEEADVDRTAQVEVPEEEAARTRSHLQEAEAREEGRRNRRNAVAEEDLGEGLRIRLLGDGRSRCNLVLDSRT